MPEKKSQFITFNPANTKLLKEHIKRFREKLELSIENVPTPAQIKEEPTTEEKQVSVAAEQKPKTLTNFYGRAYAPHIGWGKSIMENGGTV